MSNGAPKNHIMDSKWRCFIVEGRSDGAAMKALYEKIDKSVVASRNSFQSSAKNRQVN